MARPNQVLWDALCSLQELGYSLPSKSVREKFRLCTLPGIVAMVRANGTESFNVAYIDKTSGHCVFNRRVSG